MNNPAHGMHSDPILAEKAIGYVFGRKIDHE
jgi:hypothetical protein